MNYLKYFSFLFIFSFISCEKDEIPIDPHNSGDIITQEIIMDQDYKYQVFYNLKNNLIVSENIKTNWDLGFDSRQDNHSIILNSSTRMQAALVSGVSFEDINNVNSSIWNWDNPKGIQSGTAISCDTMGNNIYIIDRGYLINGNSRGYKKLMILELKDDSYKIRYADLDNSNDTVIQINKQIGLNFITYSFDINNTVSIYPGSDNWDLLFTQYTQLFSDTTTPSYLVTGVLINYLNNIQVALDTLVKFNDINISMVNNYSFSQNQDVIGYDWKNYDLDNNVYSINDDITYIIRDNDGRYFKIHFLDFYNSYGEKGYPKFEVQEL